NRFMSDRQRIKCALYPENEVTNDLQRRTCEGHFCLLQEDISHNETTQRACLLIDETHSEYELTSGVITVEFSNFYICNREYCNEDLESTGFQRPAIIIEKSSQNFFRTPSVILTPLLFMVFL
ncbi:hypothetical protein PENTCL1PPCAC_17218, partial [Pristionchus entomophagus]